MRRGLPGATALAVAMLGALVLAGIALAFRVLGSAADAGGAERPPAELLPLLFSAAGLCAAGLLRHRFPAGAWLATAGVAALAALEILGGVRARQSSTSLDAWPWLALVSQAALFGAAAIAAVYAIRHPTDSSTRSAIAWRFVVGIGLGVVAIVTAWAMVETFRDPTPLAAAGTATDSLPPLRISARIAAGYIAVAALAGVLGDLAAPLRRARARTRSLRELPRAITEELLPSQTSARRHGRDEERARLAADLHAFVLPDLRRAAQAADTATPAAQGLRQAVEGVERLMHERQSVVLEEFGLVAALEWLAERTQEQSSLDIEIELDGSDVNDRAAVPLPVARAAFRVALLALDNVVRHAGATRAVVQLVVEAGRGRLAVIDDGRTLDREPSGRGGRGLIDMRTAAHDVGGELLVERRDGATAIEMTWRPAAGE